MESSTQRQFLKSYQASSSWSRTPFFFAAATMSLSAKRTSVSSAYLRVDTGRRDAAAATRTVLGRATVRFRSATVLERLDVNLDRREDDLFRSAERVGRVTEREAVLFHDAEDYFLVA